MAGQMHVFALLLFSFFYLVPCIFGTVTIPGSGCGISYPIRTLESLPDGFDGDLSAFACTNLHRDEEYQKHKATLPGTIEAKACWYTVPVCFSSTLFNTQYTFPF